MVILGIETSCDETALALIETRESGDKIEFTVISNIVHSQVAIHKQYGGVFPMMAKREHAKNLTPLLKQMLMESDFLKFKVKSLKLKVDEKLQFKNQNETEKILERESELLKQFLEFIPSIERPPIDVIAVTEGPGLEPALWVGINFAKALSAFWNIPLVPVNHMEGHILVSLLRRNEENSVKRATQNVKKDSPSLHAIRYMLHAPCFPSLALLISGGHTELVLINRWLEYKIIGQTRDDALGEAFDKVARILGLPYPGGPEISALAEKQRQLGGAASKLTLPRPMLYSNDLDFSFSGLKTAVLYMVKKLGALDEKMRSAIALEFENAVTEVILKKVKMAIETNSIKSIILGGGVVANKHIRESFEILAENEGLELHTPAIPHATDNALMIAVTGYFHRDKALNGYAPFHVLKNR